MYQKNKNFENILDYQRYFELKKRIKEEIVTDKFELLITKGESRGRHHNTINEIYTSNSEDLVGFF